jgi:glycosyltransferase involved in cell wall biosynthesis
MPTNVSETMNAKSTPKYVVITPVRDEAQYVENTIRSMTQQTVKPIQWVLVDDGSTDATGEIIDRHTATHPWITTVHRKDRGCRKAGAGVMEAFYEGFQKVTARDWDFLVKLDGDLAFGSQYFDDCFAEFTHEPNLGIGGGVICHEVNGTLQVEQNPQFHVRGATKIYRRACWQDIGGLIRTPGWDTMDEVEANRLGWSTRSFPNLQVRHYRYTGAADGAWSNSVKNGMGSYICGFHPLYMLSKSICRAIEKPYFLRSIGLLYGFILGYIRNMPQVANTMSIRYLRDQQLRRLSLRPTIWK